MTVKRIRTFGTTIGAATAVALAMGLAGCQPAHFDPNNPTGTTNANPAQTGTTTPANNANTGGVTTPAAATKPMVIKGLVSLTGGPMANAQMRVVDAVSGKALGIIAAGAGNIVAAGAGNYRAHRHLQQATGAVTTTAAAAPKVAALVKTDGAGQFKLAVLGLAPGKVARIIATANGKTVTCLVSGSGKTLDKGTKKPYRPLQTDDGFQTVNDPSVSDADRQNGPNLDELNNFPATESNMDPVTTAAEQATSAMLAISGLLSDPTAALERAMEKGAEQAAALQVAFSANPNLAELLVAAINPDTGNSTGNSLQDALSAAGVLDAFQSFIKDAAQEYAAAAATGGVQSGGFSPSDFAAMGISVTSTGFQIGGETIGVPGLTIDNGDDTTTPPPPTDDPNLTPDEPVFDDSNVQEAASLGNPVFTGANFRPDVKIYNNGSLTYINVKQNAGENDIGMIVARFPGTPFTGSAQSILGSGQTNAPAKLNGNLSVVQDNAATYNGIDIASLTFSATVPASAGVWKGHLKDGAYNVADFQVYVSGGYTYVVTNYEMNEAYAVTTSGHTTRLQTPYLPNLSTANNVEIYMESREDEANPGSTAERVDAVNSGAPGAFPAF